NRVRGFALVFISESAPQAPDAIGERCSGNTPAGDIHLMDTLVADLAVAEVPEPVPVVVDDVLVILLLWGGAEPQIEVEVGRNFLWTLESDARAGLAGVRLGHQQFAVVA